MSQRIQITSGEAYPVAFVHFESDHRPEWMPFEPNGELTDEEAHTLRGVLIEYEQWQKRLLDMKGVRE